MSEALALADSVRNYRNKMTQLLGEIDALTTENERLRGALIWVTGYDKLPEFVLDRIRQALKENSDE